jgi:ribonuclease HII
MPWIVGIDEAGYGPNLGPFVMSAVAFEVPGVHSSGNLWKALSSIVRRSSDDEDDRMVVDDSKLVYSGGKTLCGLERSVLAAVHALRPCIEINLAELLNGLASPSLDELALEAWYEGSEPVPGALNGLEIAEAATRWSTASNNAGIGPCHVRSVIVCPSAFNSVTKRWGSKGAVLGHGLRELLHWCLQTAGVKEPVLITVDKHGGRNNYAAMLQEACPDCFVAVQEEGMLRSAYRLLGLGRKVSLAFQPRADADHFTVALASMTSKYLREMLMREFNRFWQAKVEGLKPTAGYPGDSARFWSEIRPAVKRLGIPKDKVWRSR